MAIPSVSIIKPVIQVPYVTADSLVVRATFFGRPDVTSVGFRLYEPQDTPPSFTVKKVDEYFSVVSCSFFGLEDRKSYVVEAVAYSADGASNPSVVDFTWDVSSLFTEGVALPLGVEESWEPSVSFEKFMSAIPSYYSDDPLMRTWFRSLALEFERAERSIEQVRRWVLPFLASGEGLARWERVLGITSYSGIPDEARRVIVITHLLGRIDPSAAGFIKTLSLLTTNPPRLLEDHNNFTVILDTSGDPILTAILEELVDRMLPAHLVVDYSPREVQFDYGTRRFPLTGVWPRGEATDQPNDPSYNPGGFDKGGMV